MKCKLFISFAIGTILCFNFSYGQNIAVNTSGNPAAATNMFEVTQTSTAANMVAIYAIHSGATVGTGYGLFVSKTGASTTNIAGYFNASGGTNNYALIVPSGGGNVGIGTTTPGNILSITTSTALDGIFQTDGTRWLKRMSGTVGGGSYNGITQANDNAIIYSGGALGSGALVIAPWAAGTSGIRMDNNGYVGIGTSAPSRWLDVEGSGAGVHTACFLNTTGYGIALGSTTGSIYGSIQAYNSGAGTSAPLAFQCSLGGNVGIGTTTSAYAKLQVQGMVGNTAGYFSGSSNSQGIGIVSDWPGIYFNCYFNGGIKAMAANGYPSMLNSDQSTGGLYFLTTSTANTVADATVSPIERMRITGGGYLGVGTSSPAAPLHVYTRNSGIGGTGASSDNPTTAVIEAGVGSSRYNDWPSGWGGGISTWDICGASAYLTGITYRSDRRYKQNIISLSENKTEIIKKLMEVQPVSYFLNPAMLKADSIEYSRKRFGFIANDIEKIFPNLVANAGAPESVFRGLEYDGFIPVLVLVVQDQQQKIDELNKKITALENAIKSAGINIPVEKK